MTSCTQKHEEPSPKKPWWDWCCSVCTPELYDKITVADHRRQPLRTVECPMCLLSVHYKAPGRMSRHTDDSQPCIFSNLSIPVADLLFEAILGKHSIEWAVAQIIVPASAKGSRPKLPLQARYRTEVEEWRSVLVQTRISRDISEFKMASTFRISIPQFRKWEREDTRINFDKFLTWAKLLGVSVRQGDFELLDFDEFRRSLKEIREQKGWTFKAFNNSDVLNDRIVASWESGTRVPDVAGTLAWSRFLGIELTMIGIL